MRLIGLYRYPVKGLGGEALSRAEPRERGLRGDRRWMFVDGGGRFISQRGQPQLTGFRAELVEDNHLRIVRRSDETVLTEVEQAGGDAGATIAKVTVWDDTLEATVINFPEQERVVAALGIPGARLVYLDRHHHRPVDPRYARHNEEVSFADGFPYLFTTTASGEELSRRLGRPVDPLRFRPNFLIETDVPFAEDDWRDLRLGGHAFYTPKPCARCQVVTLDPRTGRADPDVLGRLAAFRRVGRKVLFGMNGVWSGGAGTVSVGDPLSVRGTTATD